LVMERISPRSQGVHQLQPRVPPPRVDLTHLRPGNARENRGDMSLFGVASSIGVAESELEKLLAGQAGVGVAKKLGVSRMDLQRFIAGEVSMSMA